MQQENDKYRVNTDVLNVRKEARASSDKLGTLKADELIEMIGESPDGLWIKFHFKHPDKDADAWVSKSLLKKAAYIPPPGEDFPWMAIAEKEKGVSQIDGSQHNPRILEFLRSTTLGIKDASSDETSWCSAFVNWCLEQAGYETTNNAVARSWLTWGQGIELPRRGCIVVFTRDKKFGHVAFYLEETETHIKVLGGNQTNPGTGKSEVCEKSYPKLDLLGYRIPK